MTTYQLRTPARLNARAWGVAMGLLCGLGLFLATNILLLKGGPVIGPRLALLGVYLPGYKVTFGGSLIGLGYGPSPPAGSEILKRYAPARHRSALRRTRLRRRSHHQWRSSALLRPSSP